MKMEPISPPLAGGSNAGLGATWGEYADACQRLHVACERVRTTLAVMNAKERNEAAAKLPPLPDGEIDRIAEQMPGGLDGFLKGWGWRQFARAIEDAHGIGCA
jgi:hypothetical protein